MELQTMPTPEMPIFGNTLKLMKFWSYLFVHNWRRYVAMTPYTLINLTQYVDIYLSTEPLDFIIRNVYLAVLFTNTVVRGVLLCVQRGQYERFLELIKVYYLQLLVSLLGKLWDTVLIGIFVELAGQAYCAPGGRDNASFQVNWTR